MIIAILLAQVLPARPPTPMLPPPKADPPSIVCLTDSVGRMTCSEVPAERDGSFILVPRREQR